MRSLREGLGMGRQLRVDRQIGGVVVALLGRELQVGSLDLSPLANRSILESYAHNQITSLVIVDQVQIVTAQGYLSVSVFFCVVLGGDDERQLGQLVEELRTGPFYSGGESSASSTLEGPVAASTVIATQKGAASVLAEIKSMLTTFLSGWGFSHMVR